MLRPWLLGALEPAAPHLLHSAHSRLCALLGLWVPSQEIEYVDYSKPEHLQALQKRVLQEQKALQMPGAPAPSVSSLSSHDQRCGGSPVLPSMGPCSSVV